MTAQARVHCAKSPFGCLILSAKPNYSTPDYSCNLVVDMSKLAILLPVTFGIMAVGAAVAIDFQKKSILSEDASFSVADYVSAVKENFGARTRETVANKDIGDYFGPAPEGWSRRDYVVADMDILRAGAEPETQQTSEIGEIPADVSAALDAASQRFMRGTQLREKTYSKGETMVVVGVRFLPARIMKGAGAKQLGMMQDVMALAENPKNFAIVRGLKFVEPTALSEDRAYRQFNARMGRQVEIKVLTNASEDQDVLEVLAQLDLASMNTMMADPVPGMGEADVLLLASADQRETEASPLEAIAKQLEQEALEQAKAALAAAPDEPVVPQSFVSRLSGLFGSSSAQEEDQAPKRMVCTVQQGFKRCVFPSE